MFGPYPERGTSRCWRILWLCLQMRSHMKKTIFEEQMAKAIMNWHRAAKEKEQAKEVVRRGTTWWLAWVHGYPARDAQLWLVACPLLSRYRRSDLENASASPISSPSPSDIDLSEFDRSILTRHSENDRTNPDSHITEVTFHRPQQLYVQHVPDNIWASIFADFNVKLGSVWLIEPNQSKWSDLNLILMKVVVVLW